MDSAPTFAPGVFPEMPFETYLAIQAFSASTAMTLLRTFPARLKDPQPPRKPLEDGRIAHKLVLEGVNDLEDSERYIVTPKGFSMSHTTKHADLIAHIEATGAQPISQERADMINGMFAALKRDKVVMQALSNGRPEVSAFWIDEEFGIPCKARFDWLPNTGRLLPDYKTAASIDDDELARSVKNYGMAHRSAHYQDAARAIGHGKDHPEGPLYLPIWQEKTAPYWISMRPVDSMDVHLVRPEIAKAKAIYQHCLEYDHWPGPTHFREIALPGWERKRLEFEYQIERESILSKPMNEAFS